MDTDNKLAEGFKNPGSLTRWVKYFLYLQIIISVIALVSGYMEYQLLTDYSNNVYTSQAQATADAEANDARQGVIGIIQLVIFIVSGFLILKWIYRANYNARQLGAEDMRFTPGWSIGWYFVPIATFWKPYQAMKEIYKASHTPDNWKDTEVPSMLPWWWFFWIISSLMGNASFRVTMRAQKLDELIAADVLTFVSDILSIPLALLTTNLIRTNLIRTPIINLTRT